MHIFNTIFFIFLLGVLPAFAWLWFWLREDNEHPEPRRYILLTFLYGALAVPFALGLQLLFNAAFSVSGTEAVSNFSFIHALFVVFVWAGTEEFVKYKAAWRGGLNKTITDEAVDVPIYMISAALGFAALENALFLLTPFLNGNIQEVIITTKLRFVGSTLVHVASSALIGMFIGYSLFFMRKMRKIYTLIGFILATLLHALFNLFIIKGSQNSFVGFLLIWLFIILIIVLFERIKKIKVNKIDNVRK
jgi:RsiW-degrading membrane proteinase PrsW (M82 family)